MRILMNVNDQITATMMEKHLQASSLQADVTATVKDMMLEILRGCRIEIVIFYAEQVDNRTLLGFFNEIKAIDSNIKCILFVRKDNLALVSEELEDYLDECITIPLDSGDFMIRLRRLIRAAGQAETQLEKQPPAETYRQPLSPGNENAAYQPVSFPPEPIRAAVPETTVPVPDVITAAASPEHTQPLRPEEHFDNWRPAQQNAEAFSQPLPAPPPVTLYTADGTVYTRPIDTSYSYAPENYAPKIPEQPAAQVFPPPEPAGKPEKAAENKETAKKKKNGFVTFFGFLSKVIFGLLILLIVVMAVFMVKSKLSGGTPSFAGYQFYGVLSGSMNGTDKTSFDTGSLVFVKFKDPKTIVEGDIITFRGLSAGSQLTTHRVVKVNKGDKLTFTTRGDANNVDDPNPVSAERVVGTVRGHIPFAGYFTGFAETKTGLILLIFIPGSLVIVYELFNVFKILKTERKKEEDK